MSHLDLGRVKTKSDLVVMPSGRQIFAFFCSPHDRRAQNSGCGYTAQRFYTARVKVRHPAPFLQCPLIPRICCKTRLQGWFSWRVPWVPSVSLILPRRLHRASCWRRRGTTEEFGKTPQVQRGCGQQHLILYPAQASQAKPVELEDALHVCESHLDLLALPP
jgi:hypothetical protein